MPDPQSPQIILRPKLAHWMFARGLKRSDGAEALGCTTQTLRRYCLPFDDAERRIPDEIALERIVRWTDGAITAADFYPPHLNGLAGEFEEACESAEARP